MRSLNIVYAAPARAEGAAPLWGVRTGARRNAVRALAAPRGILRAERLVGRLIIDGRIVLDSCLGNTMPIVDNMLFWTGTAGLFSWAEIAAVRAELFRAHAIGGDSFFVEADLATGCTLRFALSLACAGASTGSETIICEKAILRYSVGGQIEVSWKDGRSERISSGPFLRPRGEPPRVRTLPARGDAAARDDA